MGDADSIVSEASRAPDDAGQWSSLVSDAGVAQEITAKDTSEWDLTTLSPGYLQVALSGIYNVYTATLDALWEYSFGAGLFTPNATAPITVQKNSHTDPIYDHEDNMSRGAIVQASPSGGRNQISSGQIISAVSVTPMVSAPMVSAPMVSAVFGEGGRMRLRPLLFPSRTRLPKDTFKHDPNTKQEIIKYNNMIPTITSKRKVKDGIVNFGVEYFILFYIRSLYFFSLMIK